MEKKKGIIGEERNYKTGLPSSVDMKELSLPNGRIRWLGNAAGLSLINMAKVPDLYVRVGVS